MVERELGYVGVGVVDSYRRGRSWGVFFFSRKGLSF